MRLFLSTLFILFSISVHAQNCNLKTFVDSSYFNSEVAESNRWVELAAIEKEVFDLGRSSLSQASIKLQLPIRIVNIGSTTQTTLDFQLSNSIDFKLTNSISSISAKSSAEFTVELVPRSVGEKNSLITWTSCGQKNQISVSALIEERK